MKFLSCISHLKPSLSKLGIYPIVNRAENLLPLFQAGVTTAQIRIKDLQGEALFAELKQADLLAKQFNVRLFINDYWQIALELNAYGVHLGQEDLEEASLAKIHQGGVRLGVSTHNLTEISQITEKLEIIPSYVAIGAIFATESKKIATPTIGLKSLKKWTSGIDLPVVAIGGINSDNIQQVISCGVSGVAMIEGIYVKNSPLAETIFQFQQYFKSVSRETNKRFKT